MSSTSSSVSEKIGNLPPYLAAAFERLVDSSAKLSRDRYEPYQELRVAPFPEQINQYLQTVSRTGSYEPHLEEALKAIRKGRRSFVGHHEKYMRPYKESVSNKLPVHATRTFETGIMPEFQKRFLKSSHPETLRNKQIDRLIRSDLKDVYEDQVAEGMSKAYKDALKNYNIHKARQLEAAHPLTSLGISKQAQHLAHAQALKESGSLLYDLNQRNLELAYENWKERQRYPYEAQAQYASTIQGVPFVPSTYQHTEIPKPSQTWHGSDWKNLGLNILGDTLTSGLSAQSERRSHRTHYSPQQIPAFTGTGASSHSGWGDVREAYGRRWRRNVLGVWEEVT